MPEYKWTAGQKVVYNHNNCEDIRTIDRVTPSGWAVVGDRKFNADGKERGASAWSPSSIVPATDEKIEELGIQYAKEAVIQRIIFTSARRLVMRKLPLGTLEKILGLLEGEETIR
jgi:hypothetical protein